MPTQSPISIISTMVNTTTLRPPGDRERETIERLASMRNQLLSSIRGCESQMYTWTKSRDEFRATLERNDAEVARLSGVLGRIAENPNRDKQYKIALLEEQLKKELASIAKNDRKERIKRKRKW